MVFRTLPVCLIAFASWIFLLNFPMYSLHIVLFCCGVYCINSLRTFYDFIALYMIINVGIYFQVLKFYLKFSIVNVKKNWCSFLSSYCIICAFQLEFVCKYEFWQFPQHHFVVFWFWVCEQYLCCFLNNLLF